MSSDSNHYVITEKKDFGRFRLHLFSGDGGGASRLEEIKAIEKAGLEFVMTFEKSKGRNPYDVSMEFRRYDVLSVNPVGGVGFQIH